MFLHVLTCFNIFYHGLTHVNQQTCRIYSPTTWSFRYIMVHHGWCEKNGHCENAVANLCFKHLLFRLACRCCAFRCFPNLGSVATQKNHHELLVSIYEHCYVNWYVNCFVNCGVSVSPHTSQRSCYTVLK